MKLDREKRPRRLSRRPIDFATCHQADPNWPRVGQFGTRPETPYLETVVLDWLFAEQYSALMKGSARAMDAIWAVKDGNGELMESLAGASRLEVGRKIVSRRYDPFRLQVSSSYRELFDRAVSQVLKREHWEIV